MTPKNIGIDASRLTNDGKTGIEEYSRQIISRLVKNKKFKFTLFGKTGRLTWLPTGKNIVWKKIKLPFLWTQIGLPWNLLFNRPDIMFIPSHVIPLLGRGKYAVTIHDLAFIHFPEAYTKFSLFYQKLAVRTALTKASKIIVPTNTTKNDLINSYRASAKNIVVVNHGIDRTRFNLKSVGSDLPFGIKKPYLLYTGRLEAKKNIAVMVKAYCLLRQESAVSHQLVLVGKEGYGYPKIKQEIDKLPPNISKDVIETDYVSDKTYQLIMKNADIYIFPSIYEGFGMPILEAMACKVPVVASDTNAIKEITAGKAVLFNHRKPFALAAQLSRLIHHPYQKEELAVSGWLYSKKFSWEDAAQATLKTLEEI